MRIGEAAAALGVPTHVLRHWEDVGVLVPRRSVGGQRDYDEELVVRGRLVQLGQRAGLSLADMRRLYGQDHDGRVRAITQRREELRRRMRALQRADDFLAHVLACRHPVAQECPDCSGFASEVAASSRRFERGAAVDLVRGDLDSRV